MRITAEPRSDQLNADDFVGGPGDYTVTGVVVGKAEQKYDIQLEGEKRVWRPPLTMLRILIACWGDDAAQWEGRRVRLFRDPNVRFGRDQVGGIRISHLSHIDGPRTVKVTESRGKRAPFTVEPLPMQPATVDPSVSAAMVEACMDVATLQGWWKTSPDLRAQIEARAAFLQSPPEPTPDTDPARDLSEDNPFEAGGPDGR